MIIKIEKGGIMTATPENGIDIVRILSFAVETTGMSEFLKTLKETAKQVHKPTCGYCHSPEHKGIDCPNKDKKEGKRKYRVCCHLCRKLFASRTGRNVHIGLCHPLTEPKEDIG